MADTRISKIQIRRGNLSDLPILSEGELGYALDVQRIFIGNSTQTIATGDGTETTFTIPTSSAYPLTSVYNPRFYIDGTEVNATDYTVASTSITFATPPAANEVITMRWNSELVIQNNIKTPPTMELAASAAAGTSTGFSFNTTLYDTVFMNYSIKLGAGLGVRAGSLRIVVDETAGTYYIDDQYNTLTSTMDITFDGSITNNVFELTYQNNESSTATVYYTFELWKM